MKITKILQSLDDDFIIIILKFVFHLIHDIFGNIMNRPIRTSHTIHLDCITELLSHFNVWFKFPQMDEGITNNDINIAYHCLPSHLLAPTMSFFHAPRIIEVGTIVDEVLVGFEMDSTMKLGTVAKGRFSRTRDTTNKIQISHNIYIIPKPKQNCNKKWLPKG